MVNDARDGSVIGRCLCGTVSFEIDRLSGPFELCHCSRCRKTSGSAFFAAVAAERSGFRWRSGRQAIRSFDAPILHVAPAYRSCFCSVCGSPVPDPAGEGQRIEIPAGLLDGSVGVKPDKHIYVEHKAPWYEIDGRLPRYDSARLQRLRAEGPSHQRLDVAGQNIELVPYKVEYAIELVKMWRRSFQRAMGLEEHNRSEDLHDQMNFFARIDPRKITVVADTVSGDLIGLMVQEGRELEHLYVHVDWQGMGVGSTLLNQAKAVSPGGLELFAFQKNKGAQAFYLSHGFREVRRGFAEPADNPWADSREQLADIRLCWSPDSQEG